jgi:hypothetical protein
VSVLRGTLVPRILLAIIGVLMLLLAWGSITSLITFGVSAETALTLLFALLIAVICFWAAARWTAFHPGEK